MKAIVLLALIFIGCKVQNQELEEVDIKSIDILYNDTILQDSNLQPYVANILEYDSIISTADSLTIDTTDLNRKANGHPLKIKKCDSLTKPVPHGGGNCEKHYFVDVFRSKTGGVNIYIEKPASGRSVPSSSFYEFIQYRDANLVNSSLVWATKILANDNGTCYQWNWSDALDISVPWSIPAQGGGLAKWDVCKRYDGSYKLTTKSKLTESDITILVW